VASTSQRSAFEQLLCQQLLSFSELTEALAERVLLLESRLVGLERQLATADQAPDVDAEIVDLLCQSEDRVRKVKDVLGTAEVIALDSARQQPQADDQVVDMDDADTDADENSDPDGEMEYVDDPQIDLLSA
jgi:hypothetical protein